jgi:Gpi18-like mannosyltransferase
VGEHQGSGSASRLDRIKLWAAFALAVFALHSIPFFQYPPGDLAYYVQPWYRHIIATGRVQVFAEPFGNYTPPYLYLLSLTTLLYGVMALVYQIKLLALLGALWIVYASCRLCDALNAPRWGAFGILLLPSIVFNTSLLGQADTFWVAPCVLSLAASIRQRWFWVAFWSGLAFAFKAQAVFFAPFVVYLFLKNRVPLWHWLVPIGVYVAAMLPAWLVGWPAWDLATVYFRQVHEPLLAEFVSDSASWWTLFGYTAKSLALKSFWFGFATAAIGVIAYLYYLPRLTGTALVAAAVIATAGLPFLLPGMHERFFILADVLAFLYAYLQPSRNSIIAAALMQVASALPVAAWAFSFQHGEVCAPFFALGSLLIFWQEIGRSSAVAHTKDQPIARAGAAEPSLAK